MHAFVFVGGAATLQTVANRNELKSTVSSQTTHPQSDVGS